MQNWSVFGKQGDPSCAEPSETNADAMFIRKGFVLKEKVGSSVRLILTEENFRFAGSETRLLLGLQSTYTQMKAAIDIR